MQLFNEFSILSWNIRGVVNSQGKRNYRDLVYKYQPSLFVILETHALFARVEKLWASLGYFPAVIVESQGFFTTNIMDTTSQCAIIKVSLGGHHWFVSVVYDYLPTFTDTVQGAWALIEDFNEICPSAESCGELFS
ncbi:hypothetical protein POPTR_010G031125v4 [Populus trichocarpa]|uniref:Uncharacterized protein n=1 Tax=Populus trichocarpa TaxID=3694 RepID=A0ACC0SCC2_POPTR|nr:hypothetical protein POPTR_010G031125v4 [Populus trichocarpa]